MSRSRRSTTSVSTTTCSSRGTRRRSGSTRSSTTCWATGAGPPARTPETCGWWGTAGRSAATRSRRSWRATTCPTGGSTSSGTRRPNGSTSSAQAEPDDLPLVLVPDREVLRSPSTLELAGALGLRTRAEQPLYDLCIVGGGPAGLAAAVYARLRGPADRRGRTRSTRWTGRSERLDRELPRLPEGAVRRRPHPPCGRPGGEVRRRDGARPRRRRASRRAVRCAPCASTAPARWRRGRCSSRPGSRTDDSRRPGSRLAVAASTTARARARRSSARARRCTSSGPRTLPARRR